MLYRDSAIAHVPEERDSYGVPKRPFNLGLTQRDYIAVELMKALMVRTDQIILTDTELADRAYTAADVLIQRSYR